MITPRLVVFILLVDFSAGLSAEIDKIYHPYVEANRSEVEYRMLIKNVAEKDDTQIHRLSVGHSFTDRFSLEAYAIGENLPNSDFSVDSYELEGKLQLTEQGEYWSDWGLLFEAERDVGINRWDTVIGLLWEKELGKFVGTVNFLVDYEFGPGVKDEFDTSFHSQVKYRWSQYFEPAVELYVDERAHGAGPVLLGSKHFGRSKLNWEIGLIFGFNGTTAGRNLRFLLDYEF